MTVNYQDPEALETFLRQCIRGKTELDKLDFKRDLAFRNPREKLELIKDINALANTYDLQFDDHGFLIFGVDREAGRVSHHVALLDELGTDKLESQIMALVQSHIEPAPRFSLYRFTEPDIGSWGAIVLWPNQTPPFIFKKAGTYQGTKGSETLWREGEWRLRRGAQTVLPRPEDIAHVIQLRVQGVVAPLNARIADLEYRIAHVQGQVDTLVRGQEADVTGTLITNGKEVHQIVYTLPETAGRQALSSHRIAFEQYKVRCRLSERGRGRNLDSVVQVGYQWAELKQKYLDHLKNRSFGSREDASYPAVVRFLEEWQLYLEEEDQDFSQVAWYEGQQRNGRFLYGNDEKRAEAYTELIHLAAQIKPEVTNAARFAPYQELTLRLHNPSGRPTGQLKVTITCQEGGELYRFAPQDLSHGHRLDFPSYRYNQEIRLPAAIETQAELLPGEDWTTLPFAVKFTSTGMFKLQVRVLAQNLPNGREFTIEVPVISK